jgi:hypothetical protein
MILQILRPCLHTLDNLIEFWDFFDILTIVPRVGNRDKGSVPAVSSRALIQKPGGVQIGRAQVTLRRVIRQHFQGEKSFECKLSQSPSSLSPALLFLF